MINTGHVAQNDHPTIGSGEAERGVIQHQPHQRADAEQRADPPPIQEDQNTEQAQEGSAGQDDADLNLGSFCRGYGGDIERLSR